MNKKPLLFFFKYDLLVKLLFLLVLIQGLEIHTYAQSDIFTNHYDEFVKYKETDDSLASISLDLAYAELQGEYEFGLEPGIVFFNKGYDFFGLADYKQSLNCFFIAKQNFSAAKDSCMLKSVLFNIGSVISTIGSSEASISYYISSNKINCSSSSTAGTSDLLYYYNLGILFSSIDLHEDAKKQFELGLLSKNEIKSDTLNRLLTELAYNYEEFELGNTDKAINGHLKLLENKGSIEKYDEAFYYANSDLGNFYLAKMNLELAEHYFKVAKGIENAVSKSEFESMDLLSFAKLNLKKGLYDSAQLMASRALALSQSIGSTERERKAFVVLIDVYEAEKEWKKAFQLSKELSSITDSINREKTKFDYLINEVNQGQKDVATMEKNVLSSQIKIDRRNYALLIAFILLVVGISAFYFLHRSREKQRKLNYLLTASNEHKEKIMATLTHDIRSPLGDVENILDLMEMDAMTPKDKSLILTSMKKKIGDLRSNVDSILYWSVEQLKGAKAKKTSIVILDVITITRKYVQSRVNNSELQIFANIVPSNLAVYVDASHIEVILRNVLSNAVKFSNHGGKIIISAAEKDGLVSISVQDFGVGIHPQNFDKILGEEIYTTKSSKTGVGVGLRLVKEYLRLNNGDIFFVSEKGKGSTFTVVLPACRNMDL